MTHETATPNPTRHVKILRPVQDFMRTESASGVLLLLAVIVALVWANGPYADSYHDLWGTKLAISLGSSTFSLDLHHWVNDGLMTLFFFVVGLEIKREMVEGELRDRRRAIAPICAALGGMIVPALIFWSFNAGTPDAGGWGVPMATDIAIVLGVLALLGSRVPASLKTFLLTLAIVDDIGAIAVIAAFYSPHAIHPLALVVGIALLGVIWMARRVRIRHTAFYVVSAIGLWLAVYAAGIHATLAGVALAMITPSRPLNNPEYLDAESLQDLSSYEAASETVSVARGSVSAVEWLQHLVHPWSSYLILPLFALANAGVAIEFGDLGNTLTSSVAAGVFCGLVLGKTLGISLATFIAHKFLKAPLPTGLGMQAIVASSVLAGIGFTVSLFVTELAFESAASIDEAKVGVLFGSLIAGVAGSIAIILTTRKKTPVSS